MTPIRQIKPDPLLTRSYLFHRVICGKIRGPSIMKIKFIVLLALANLFACGGKPSANENVRTVSAVSPTPAPAAIIAKDGDYNGKGVVTKLNVEQGSIELNHEEIKGMMPAMQMEFFVSDKKILDGLKVGDNVDFVLRYKNPTETIVSIKKAQ
jgi:Cu/Ag efflux protein CusF